MEIHVSGAVEGLLDEVVVRRLISFAGAIAGPIHVKNGKSQLLEKLAGYNQAASIAPWIVVVDLDQDEECAPLFRHRWLPTKSDLMLFRIAVREVESWLIADRERLAKFLSVPVSDVPVACESLGNPKQIMIDLASRSRRRDIRTDMVPRSGSGRHEGPAYTSRLIEFVIRGDLWRPHIAATNCRSLDSCLARLKGLVGSS